jgi:hypothetical protein
MLTNVFYTLQYKLYMRRPMPDLEPVETPEDKTNGQIAQRKVRYQPPQKRNKKR